MPERPSRFPRAVSVAARRDEGVSLVEILVALTVLLIALTGIVAMMSASTLSARMSRQKAAMLNAGASYLEAIRGMAWERIGVPGGYPAGTLTTDTVTIDGFAITCAPTVTWGRPEEPSAADRLNYKTVRITVTTQSNLSPLLDRVVLSTVRDRWGLGTNPSNVWFVSPPGGTVVWGPVNIVVQASTNSPARDLKACSLYDSGNYTNSKVLIGSLPMSGRVQTVTFNWAVSSSTREGMHELSAEASDTETACRSDALRILVDNYAPTWPVSSVVTATTGSGSAIDFVWSPAYDGTDTDWVSPLEADHYFATLRQQPADSASASDYMLWPAVTSYDKIASASETLTVNGLNPFSRYALVVGASSPDRGTGPGLVTTTSNVGTGITKSGLEATWSTAHVPGFDWDVTAVVRVPSGPTFPWSGTATTSYYAYWPATGMTTLIGTVSSSAPSWSSSYLTVMAHTEHDKTAPQPFELYAETTLTPVGYGGGAPITIRSCQLGPPADSTLPGPQPMVVVVP